MRRWLALTVLALAVVGLAQEETQSRREAAARDTLRSFWTAFVRGDSALLRELVDLPLTLIEQAEGERGGSRYVITEESWAAFRSGLPATPIEARDAQCELAGIRLEWLDERTCLAVYDFQAQLRDETLGGHFATVMIWDDTWKIVVSSIPL